MSKHEDWSIQDVARLTGVTSRALRHYDTVGLLAPSRIGAGGYRFYDHAGLLRLQRILLLRDLGLGLTAIATALDSGNDEVSALRAHLSWLESERGRLADQIGSVRGTIDALEKGQRVMASEMFKGFDHSQYKEEVEERWGAQAYRAGDSWWSQLNDAEKGEFMNEQKAIAQAFADAKAAGLPVSDDAVRQLAQRQYDWLAVSARGAGQVDITAEYFVGLGDMYIADPRFTKAYDWAGEGTAQFVRDAMVEYARRNL
jgi:MerR family transcriptional regulator, thiopeptide resistance regulator